MGTNQALARMVGIIVSLFVSVMALVCALLLAVEVAELTKGHNYSDVGVPMYTHAGEALLLGLFTYVNTVLLFFVLVRLVWKSRDFMHIYGLVNILFIILVWGFLLML